MLYPHRIEPPQIERPPQRRRIKEKDPPPPPRCKLRARTPAARWEVEHRPGDVHISWASFGYCQSGARSCAECPRAKFDPSAPEAIAEGDMVRTTWNEVLVVERFETRSGCLTGYAFLRTPRGAQRSKISDITLYRKAGKHEQLP